jgi:hypothetical protein
MKNITNTPNATEFTMGMVKLASLVLLGVVLFLSQAAAQSPVIFDTSGTFPVPAGVLNITVEAWGAGGGGGGGGNPVAGGGGGGGGAYTVKTFSVSAAQVYTVTVGGGGTAGTSAAAGTSGGDSTINLQTGPGPILVKAVGGANGTASGGAGGLFTNCIPATAGIARSGGTGGGTANPNGGGGGGSATSAANGGDGTAGGAGGTGEGAGGAAGANAGSAPGGGGGGKANGSSALSGAGAAGRVKITYIVPVAPTFGGAPASQNYTERTTGQLLIAPAGTITDPDATNLNGGYLKVDITNNLRSEEDKLYIQEINNITGGAIFIL